MYGKIWPKTLALLLLSAAVRPAAAQPVGPDGRYLQAGPAAVGGLGLSLGVLDARTVYTREVQTISDLDHLLGTGDRGRVALVIGVGIRIFGFERLLGGVGYRGFDVDVAARVGPGLSFAARETRIDRNRRFVLLLDPVIRVSRGLSPARAVVLEAGTASPSVRFGIWQRF